MRLIDADAFENFVRKHCVDSLADLWCELIRRQPTIDAEPVRHARLTDITSDEWYTEWGECSICGKSNHADAKYCQWCGAKMDGESGVKK